MERLLLAILIVYQQNFKILHWCASGAEFHTQHDQANKYYSKLEDDIDNVAEICMMNDIRPLNTKEAFSMLDESNEQYLQLHTDVDYKMEDFISYTGIMFDSILKTINNILDKLENDESIYSKNSVGIKSYLENLYYEYDKEFRYINARRSAK